MREKCNQNEPNAEQVHTDSGRLSSFKIEKHIYIYHIYIYIYKSIYIIFSELYTSNTQISDSWAKRIQHRIKRVLKTTITLLTENKREPTRANGSSNGLHLEKDRKRGAEIKEGDKSFGSNFVLESNMGTLEYGKAGKGNK